jgi:hypothetical protein
VCRISDSGIRKAALGSVWIVNEGQMASTIVKEFLLGRCTAATEDTSGLINRGGRLCFSHQWPMLLPRWLSGIEASYHGPVSWPQLLMLNENLQRLTLSLIEQHSF